MTPKDFREVLCDNFRDLISSSPINNDDGVELNHLYYSIKSNTAMTIYKGVQNKIDTRFKITMSRDLPRYDNMRIKWAYLTLLNYTNMLGEKPCIYIRVGPQYNNEINYDGLHVLSLFSYQRESFVEEAFFKDLFKWILILFSYERIEQIFKEMREEYVEIVGKFQDELIEASGANLENRMFLMRFINEHFKEEEEGIFRL